MTGRAIQSFYYRYKNTILLAIFATLFLAMGTAATVIAKTAYSAESINKNGETQVFERPMFFNMLMFLGMFGCLFFYVAQVLVEWLIEKFKNRKTPRISDVEAEPLNSEKPEPKPKIKLTIKQYLLVFIPAFCDFAATYLSNFGLLYVPGSVYQMMRGSTIVFSMILAIFWRKQKQHAYHYTGVFLIIFALVAVGASMFLPGAEVDSSSTSSSSGEEEERPWYFVIIGIFLILIAQMTMAFQTVVEEILLHDIKAPITFMVGLKGLYGFICCAVFLGISYFMKFLPDAIREDIVDTYYMLKNSALITILSLFYIVNICTFNYCGTAVIQYSNAMVRNILEPLRMVFIWIVMVIIFYTISSSFGEGLGINSIVQVFGFGLLASGFLLYTRVIEMPCAFVYDREEKQSDFVELEGREVEVEMYGEIGKDVDIPVGVSPYDEKALNEIREELESGNDDTNEITDTKDFNNEHSSSSSTSDQ